MTIILLNSQVDSFILSGSDLSDLKDQKNHEDHLISRSQKGHEDQAPDPKDQGSGILKF